MPKGHRSIRSQGQNYYRQSPVNTPTTSYAPISSRSTTTSMPTTYYVAPMSSTMSQQPYSTQSQGYATGGPVQHPLSSTHYSTSLSANLPPVPLSSIRPSSGAWNPTDDQTLMAARAQGMNWAPIQQAYFPSKTPNACRKRHERLMERRSADDWDGMKLENLAKHYMTMRREIWSGLAAQTGEKWNVVEQKCMSQGLKNLQQSARSCARRERMLDPSSSLNPGGAYDPQHTDDSGIGIDDLEAEYDADGASEHSGGSNSNHSLGGYGGYQQQHQTQRYQHQSRLPSMDMGIEAIINRPGPR
ncbi:hypothetical protein D0Z07_8506 [Hyphodiscus hymeniophilus]|uniref:Myb-like domain-containing protein n=1 Tax=Hyphodiscus hymeniophilus TaxID=353542 RepID=A0A9P6VDT5_9HELO|nr:hypothetical protein D0Z07_8506 [Hyphodiscus hymeniophilus]